MLGKCYKDNDLNKLTSWNSEKWPLHFDKFRSYSKEREGKGRRGGGRDVGKGGKKRKGPMAHHKHHKQKHS